MDLLVDQISKSRNSNNHQGNVHEKAPRFNLITTKILKELSEKGMLTISLFNALIRLQYFPDKRKVVQTKMINKSATNAKHGTIEPIHRVYGVTGKVVEAIKYCSARFLDI